MSRGLASSRRSGPRFQRSSVPGRKFSMSTSASRASASSSSWPRSSRRLSVMQRLLRTSTGHSRLLPSIWPRPHSRIESGLPGGSTLITSAPRSPSSRPANGPASMPPSSRTRSPASGPAPPSGAGFECCDERVPGLIDVLLHDQRCPLAVVAPEGGHELLVVVRGLAALVGRVPDVGLVDERQVDDRAGHLGQPPVVGGGQDRVVEDLVLARELTRGDALARGQAREAVAALAQLVEVGVGDALGG